MPPSIESLGKPLERESEAAATMHRSRPVAIRRSLTELPSHAHGPVCHSAWHCSTAATRGAPYSPNTSGYSRGIASSSTSPRDRVPTPRAPETEADLMDLAVLEPPRSSPHSGLSLTSCSARWRRLEPGESEGLNEDYVRVDARGHPPGRTACFARRVSALVRRRLRPGVVRSLPPEVRRSVRPQCRCQS